MSLITGGDVLVKVLKEHGVSKIFTLHGGHIDAIFKAASDQGVELIDTRHEQGAGFGAIGYARTTGEISVAVASPGGGVANLTAAVATAFADGDPVIFVGGAPALRDYDLLPVSEAFDPVGVMRGITKWAHQVTNIEQLGYLVGRAIQIAREGRPGPVYLDFPVDILFNQIDENEVFYTKVRAIQTNPAPSGEALELMISMLKAARRPVIFAGRGVKNSDGSDLLIEFAEKSGIPVLTNMYARGTMPTDHPLYGGSFSSTAIASARDVQDADLVLILGARIGLMTGGQRSSVIPKSALVIQVDIVPEEIGRVRDIDLGVLAGARETLKSLLARVDELDGSRLRLWAETITKYAERRPSGGYKIPQTGDISPEMVAQAVSNVATENTIIIADGGETATWINANTAIAHPRGYICHGYVGSMGTGMGASLGAKVARPDSPVIVTIGDGAVGFNFMEIDTMVRHGIAVVLVVNNDGLWSMSAHGQDILYRERFNVALDQGTRYDLAAAALGAHAEIVTSPRDLQPAIQRALDSRKPALVNVITNSAKPAAFTKRFVGAAAEGPISGDGKIRIPFSDNLAVSTSV